MLKHFSWIVVLVLAGLSSCKQENKTSFTVSGSYKNAGKINPATAITKVFLQEVPFGKDQSPVSLDSATISGGDGSFTLKAPIKAQEIIELVFGDNLVAIPLINDSREIKVSIDLSKSDDYEVTGSEASKQLQDLISNIKNKNFEVDKSFAALDSLKRLGVPDSIMIIATNTKNNAIQDLNNYLKQFINTSNNPTLSVLALGWSRSFSKNDFETELNGLLKKFPDNPVLVNMKKNYDLQEAQAAEMANKPKPEGWIGKAAPEFSLPDVNGKVVSLASFRGKYVLVDFWASWCGPCRQENPNVVKAYNQFKNKNFTIVGVSLDKEKEPWERAIKEDQLTWTHISDLKFWNSKAVDVFKFEGIPFNVLIDPQGTIIGQELRGDALEEKLTEVLK